MAQHPSRTHHYRIRGENRELAEIIARLGGRVEHFVDRYEFDVQCEEYIWHRAIK